MMKAWAIQKPLVGLYQGPSRDEGSWKTVIEDFSLQGAIKTVSMYIDSVDGKNADWSYFRDGDISGLFCSYNKIGKLKVEWRSCYRIISRELSEEYIRELEKYTCQPR